jgi:hypothetical protein
MSARFFIGQDPYLPVTWADLFARGDRYDRTEADVVDALRRRRDGGPG